MVIKDAFLNDGNCSQLCNVHPSLRLLAHSNLAHRLTITSLILDRYIRDKLKYRPLSEYSLLSWVFDSYRLKPGKSYT